MVIFAQGDTNFFVMGGVDKNAFHDVSLRGLPCLATSYGGTCGSGVGQVRHFDDGVCG